MVLVYKDTKWHDVISNLKPYLYYNLISYLDSWDEARRLMLKVYNKIVIEPYIVKYSALVHMAETHSLRKLVRP